MRYRYHIQIAEVPERPPPIDVERKQLRKVNEQGRPRGTPAWLIDLRDVWDPRAPRFLPGAVYILTYPIRSHSFVQAFCIHVFALIYSSASLASHVDTHPDCLLLSGVSDILSTGCLLLLGFTERGL